VTSPENPDEAETLALGVPTPSTSSPRGGGRLPVAPAFAPGTLLAERFRVVRFIAQGGMGEVYEAEDLELRDRVALKTISHAVADDERAMERFRREVQLSRRVTHANVCRIFDIFRQRIASPDPARPDVEIAFLTMELLSGETLAQRLDRIHRFAPAEALPIVTQIAAGLSAAHRAGVIHRDFKAGNVLLVEDPAEPGATRAVVTDFGLAHARAREAEGAPSLTGSGLVAGTPAYMAPEQIEGGEVTPASDLFALGIVMYEMVTGTLPFTGHTPLSIAVRRLKEAPRPPITHVPDLDPKWNAAILRCLERDPADRFASASDLVKALAGELVAPSRGRAQAGRRRRRWIFTAAAMALLLAAAAAYRLAHRRPRAAPAPAASGAAAAAAPRSRRSVAVLGFKNLTAKPEANWLSAALSEMLTTELSAGEKLRAISGENVARAKLELAIADAESLAGDTLARIRRNLGTDYVVLGSYVSLGNSAGGQLRLDLRIQDTASGETLASLAETGIEASFLDLVSRTGARLRERLGAGELSAAEAGGARASRPSNPEAARLYAEGLARLRVFDAIGARDLLEKAAAADSRYPLAHAALAGAWSALGYDGKAREQARKAFDLSGNLSREDRLAVEGRYRETVREWDKAVEIYRTLWGFFPDNLEYGLRLAASQLSAGNRKESLATAESLGRLSGPASEDPRVDLARAQAAGSLSDYKSEQEAAENAYRKADAAGARLLAVEARVLQGDAAASLGDPKKAVALYEESREAFAAAGNLSRAAWALEKVGILAYRQGDLSRGRTLAEQSLAVYRRSGNEAGVAQALNDQANIAADQGDVAGAMRIYEQVLELQRRLGNQRHVAGSLGNIANLLQYQGDMAGSLRKHQEALPILRQLGEKSAVAVELNNTANVLAAQGDLTGARRVYEEALAIKKEIGNRSSMAYTLRDLGDLLEAQGDLAGARKVLEESLAIREQLDQTARAGETRISLSALAYEEGQPARAAEIARRSVEALDKGDIGDSRAEALAMLAQALAAQGQREEAQREITRAAPLSARSELHSVRFNVAMAAGRVHAAAGRFTEAATSFRAALDEARRSGIHGATLEARLSLAQNDLRSGRRSDARNALTAVETEARAKGFLHIAAKAARARA
jgi:tetratricopeptide (TPR) repeat protein/tRNA A-37 threonylcarbamoyl transferase component Bud32